MQNFLLVMIASILFIGCSPVSSPQSARDSDVKISTATDQPPKKSVVTLTDAAKAKMLEFLSGQPNDYIRLSVKTEGPTGFSYDLQIDDKKLTDFDMPDRTNGFLLVTDAKSSIYLDGASIDWETRVDGTAGFKFNNPNAVKQP